MIAWAEAHRLFLFFRTTMKIGVDQFRYAFVRPFGSYVLMYPSQRAASDSRMLCFS